jgi:phosphatidylglycerophosphatase A
MTRSIIKLIATWFYTGFLPKAPGTWGSLFTFPFIYLLYIRNIDIIGFGFVIFWLFFIGWWAAEGFDILQNSHDNKQIVIDEVVGQMLTVAPVYYFFPQQISWYLVAFILFRLFDITKILGIGWVDRKVPGGLGVMLDDILAGVYGAVLILIGRVFFKI